MFVRSRAVGESVQCCFKNIETPGDAGVRSLPLRIVRCWTSPAKRLDSESGSEPFQEPRRSKRCGWNGDTLSRAKDMVEKRQGETPRAIAGGNISR